MWQHNQSHEDLRHYPTEINSSRFDEELIIGNLHHNTLKWIYVLIKEGILDLSGCQNLSSSAEIYQRLFTLYFKNPNEITSEDLLEFQEILNRSVFSKIKKIIIKGGDLGHNAIFTFLLIKHLNEINLSFDLCASKYTVIALQRLGEGIKGPESQFSSPEMLPFNNLWYLIDTNIISLKDIQDIIRDHYLPHFVLISYVRSFRQNLAEKNILTYIAHNLIGLDTIEKIAKQFEIPYQESSITALTHTIDKINQLAFDAMMAIYNPPQIRFVSKAHEINENDNKNYVFATQESNLFFINRFGQRKRVDCENIIPLLSLERKLKEPTPRDRTTIRDTRIVRVDTFKIYFDPDKKLPVNPTQHLLSNKRISSTFRSQPRDPLVRYSITIFHGIEEPENFLSAKKRALDWLKQDIDKDLADLLLELYKAISLDTDISICNKIDSLPEKYHSSTNFIGQFIQRAKIKIFLQQLDYIFLQQLDYSKRTTSIFNPNRLSNSEFLKVIIERLAVLIEEQLKIFIQGDLPSSWLEKNKSLVQQTISNITTWTNLFESLVKLLIGYVNKTQNCSLSTQFTELNTLIEQSSQAIIAVQNDTPIKDPHILKLFDHLTIMGSHLACYLLRYGMFCLPCGPSAKTVYFTSDKEMRTSERANTI